MLLDEPGEFDVRLCGACAAPVLEANPDGDSAWCSTSCRGWASDHPGELRDRPACPGCGDLVHFGYTTRFGACSETCTRRVTAGKRVARAAGTPTFTIPVWTAVAACAGQPLEVMFPPKGHTASRARELCAACPVRVECLDFALAELDVTGGDSYTTRYRDGVLGGMSPAERTAEARRRAATVTATGDRLRGAA